MTIRDVVDHFFTKMNLRHHFLNLPVNTTLEQLVELILNEMEHGDGIRYQFNAPVASSSRNFSRTWDLKLHLLEFCNNGRTDSQGRVRLRDAPSSIASREKTLLQLAAYPAIGLSRHAVVGNTLLISFRK